MEIGSIYEINPQTVERIDWEDSRVLQLGEVLKYKKENIKYTGSGREAIALAIKSMEARSPSAVKKCLLPAYMCDTVFFPFVHAGWELFFYHIDKNLEAKEEELRSLVEHIKPGLLFIHSYYGVDTWKPMRFLLKEIKNQGIYIMEDVTQSYYLEGIGDDADFIIGSLRKWYAVPDGGFVVSDLPLADEIMGQSEEFTKRRLELLTEKWEYLNNQIAAEDRNKIKENYLNKNRETEEWLDCFDGINTISKVTTGILKDVDEDSCKAQRRENYKILYQALEGKNKFTLVFGNEEEAAPLYFPIYAENRDELQRFLQRHDIYAPVLWPIGEESREQLNENERYIFTHLLALPIDQRYGKVQMQRIVNVMNQYEKEFP